MNGVHTFRYLFSLLVVFESPGVLLIDLEATVARISDGHATSIIAGVAGAVFIQQFPHFLRRRLHSGTRFSVICTRDESLVRRQKEKISHRSESTSVNALGTQTEVSDVAN